MKRLGVPLQILLAATGLALCLVGIVVREGAARAGGQEVWLDIDGSDPRSLLTGHFVRFQMQSEAPALMPCPEFQADHAWIALRRDGDRYLASGSGKTREAAAALGEVAVRGRGSCDEHFSRSIDPVTGAPVLSPQRVLTTTLQLGVDRLHVDQTQAKALETALQARGVERAPAYAVISVGKDGKARLKGLSIAGRRTNLDWF
jgi:uncharacterized membrane-anchored protein